MDNNDAQILEFLDAARKNFGVLLGENELRSDRGLPKQLIDRGLELPKDWSYGGASLAIHLEHLQGLNLIAKTRSFERGRVRTLYIPTHGPNYTRMLTNQSVTIPTRACKQESLNPIHLMNLYGHEIRHIVGTPSISEEVMKPGALVIVRAGVHRFESRGSSALFGSPSIFWKYASIKSLGPGTTPITDRPTSQESH